MVSKIKLNLGCGWVYKVGYINIDKFDKSVADLICDAGDLPFKSNSVDSIEASQLIEHFDYIHCKYILSEWFRVLKPGGDLVLETPDLERTFKKFVSSDLETQKITLQWIYGVDSLGMQHKTGFTYELLKDLLQEIGFEQILREKPKTHTYEPGMRIVCKKPRDHLIKSLFACFRKRLKTELNTTDSYVLISLENWLKEVFDSYEESKENKRGWIDKMISKTAICTPLIPLTFLKECINFGFVKESEVRDRINLLNYLSKIEFHKRVFSLWIRSRKRIGKVEEEFKDFVSRLESLISDLLSYPMEYRERLEYISSLPSSHIKIFDFHIISLEAKKLFNLGVKCFYKKEFHKALKLFSKSSKINPDNPLVYWNEARLGSILKFKKYEIVEKYKKALSIAKNDRCKRMLKEELKCVRDGKKIPKEPISEYQIV